MDCPQYLVLVRGRVKAQSDYYNHTHLNAVSYIQWGTIFKERKDATTAPWMREINVCHLEILCWSEQESHKHPTSQKLVGTIWNPIGRYISLIFTQQLDRNS